MIKRLVSLFLFLALVNYSNRSLADRSDPNIFVNTDSPADICEKADIICGEGMYEAVKGFVSGIVHVGGKLECAVENGPDVVIHIDRLTRIEYFRHVTETLTHGVCDLIDCLKKKAGVFGKVTGLPGKLWCLAYRSGEAIYSCDEARSKCDAAKLSIPDNCKHSVGPLCVQGHGNTEPMPIFAIESWCANYSSNFWKNDDERDETDDPPDPWDVCYETCVSNTTNNQKDPSINTQCPLTEDSVRNYGDIKKKLGKDDTNGIE